MKVILLWALFLFNISCVSTQIIKDREYRGSIEDYNSGKIEEAFSHLPDGEDGGFITTLETEWLDLASSGQANPKNLMKQTHFFEKRKMTSITRDSKKFFIADTEEGYLPSEHEIVVHHLLTAMILLQQKNHAEARVEVLAAALILQNEFDQNNTGFDDPALRMWSASLWLALGEKNSAQVDIRRAAQLSQNDELKKLAEDPPAEIHVVFAGSTPEANYQESFPPHILSSDEKIQKLHLLGKNILGAKQNFSTKPWFDWHTKRNSSLRDFAEKSNYMTQFTGIKTLTLTERSAAFVTAHSVSVLGIALGASIFAGGIYLGIKGNINSGEYFGLVSMFAWSTAKYFVEQGTSFNDQMQERISLSEEESLAQIRAYRFVRFLPSQVQFYTSQKSSEKALAAEDFQRYFPQLSLGTDPANPKAFFYWLP